MVQSESNKQSCTVVPSAKPAAKLRRERLCATYKEMHMYTNVYVCKHKFTYVYICTLEK